MVRSEAPEPSGADQSLGDLVALAVRDVSQLLRYEIDLAKVELRGDLRRVGLAGALGGVAAFVGCLILVLLCIAFAYGLVALGIWTWAAFLIVAGTCVLVAGPYSSSPPAPRAAGADGEIGGVIVTRKTCGATARSACIGRRVVCLVGDLTLT